MAKCPFLLIGANACPEPLTEGYTECQEDDCALWAYAPSDHAEKDGACLLILALLKTLGWWNPN